MSTSAPPVHHVLAAAVAEGAVPNVTAIAADRDGIIFQGAAGPRVAGGDPADVVGAATHYRIMSMTKIIVATAALQLAEQDVLDMDAPVEHYLPDFSRIQVLDGWDRDAPRMRAPNTLATVRQLITHTAGFGYWLWDGDIRRWEQVTGTPNVLAGRTESFGAPMMHDPGTAWEYGINFEWLGRVVEVVTGQTLDVAIRQRVLNPLGMADTSFRMTPAQRARSAPVHMRSEGGEWVPTDIDISQDPQYWSGGHGLHSTPRDYIKFLRAILRGGELDGTRILSERTVERMFTNQIDDLHVPEELPSFDPSLTNTFVLGPGNRWSFAGLVNTGDLSGRRRAYSLSWAGMANTHFWIDPTAGVTAAIYSQFLPFATAASMDLYCDFESALYASL